LHQNILQQQREPFERNFGYIITYQKQSKILCTDNKKNSTICTNAGICLLLKIERKYLFLFFLNVNKNQTISL